MHTITEFDPNHHSLSAIAQVINRAYNKVHYLHEEVERISVEELEKKVSTSTLFLCMVHTIICGTVLLDKTKMEISLLTVDPQYRGRHLGALLLSHIEEVARAMEKDYIYLMVVPFMQERLIAFYQKNGFVLTGAKRPFNPVKLQYFIKPEYYNNMELHIMERG